MPFSTPIPRWEHDAVSAMLSDHFGLAGDLTALAGERDQNLRLDSEAGRYAVKIANPAEPVESLEMQQAALEHLDRVGVPVAVPQVVPTGNGERVTIVEHDGAAYPVRVVTYLEGEPLADHPGAVHRSDLGAALASVQRSLRGFFHPAAGRRFLWDVRNVNDLRPMVEAVTDAEVRAHIDGVLVRIEDDVQLRLPSLSAQVIHNDFNPDNLLVADGGLAAVIDFGDMIHGPRVADLAVAAAHQVIDCADPVAAIEAVSRGYQGLIELSAGELAVLPDLVSMRLCQLVAIGQWRAVRHPDNADYILAEVQDAAAGLSAMADVGPDALLPPPPAPTPEVATRRRRSLAPGLDLSYDTPLHLLSGDGVWLRGADGREYLDAYNNVVQVGHGHPLVARTLARQTRRLNTNTRYLVEEVVTYAERLTRLLPDGLDVCYFTNSGSEANDLAWRIARTVTGNTGVMISEHAYHGGTAAIMAMSPEELRPDQHEPWVATVPPPGGEDPAGRAAAAVDGLREAGMAPAAVFFDTVFSSDGIHPATADHLDPSVAAVRSAGGLFVADEVQAGLGRVGSRLWGFSAATLAPDIVTLGKPIGNGHPIGVVVTTESIARRFADEAYYFSTFGGNPVAAAVGTTVLDLTEQLGLPERSERVGEYVRDQVRALDAEIIGEVRGAGLFIGVEILDADGRPDGEMAARLTNAMRARGVLIGRTGPDESVLKIRPPLVFEEAHAEVLLTALTESLADGER